MTFFRYNLQLNRNNKKLTLAVKANDIAHAQAQSLDIARSLEADKFELTYGKTRLSKLSELFEKLAYNEFDYKNCYRWEGSETNGVPSVYALGRRYYVRPLILGYLDICKDKTVKNTCCNKKCVNPYHYHYLSGTNAKLGGGDLKMALAFRSQGASVPQIAKALNVHRSTIYRTFKNECLFTGSEDCR